VLLWLTECRADDPGAARADDHTREVRVELEEPLAGRVPYDRVFGLQEAEHSGRGKPARWEKIQLAGPSTLVVYWHGGIGPLDRVDVHYTQDAVEVTVLEEPAGKMAGRSSAAIVRLNEPLGGRRIRRGQA